MRARVGDLAIARFDPGDDDIKAGRRWCEHLCIVTGITHYGLNGLRYCKFIYWDAETKTNNMIEATLPPYRLVRVRPKFGEWRGTLFSLTPGLVVPVVRS